MKDFSKIITELDFQKSGGLLPAIVQDARTGVVLMLGYMSREALERTLEDKKVTFFSRSKNRLWQKGETSGHFLLPTEIKTDCDKDALLVKAIPEGPVCHTGSDTCFEEVNSGPGFLSYLEQIIRIRKTENTENSYTAALFRKGINKIAQKVGEEAVELVIEAKDDNRELFLNEAADLLFHLLVLLNAKETALSDVIAVLEQRHK